MRVWTENVPWKCTLKMSWKLFSFRLQVPFIHYRWLFLWVNYSFLGDLLSQIQPYNCVPFTHAHVIASIQSRFLPKNHQAYTMICFLLCFSADGWAERLPNKVNVDPLALNFISTYINSNILSDYYFTVLSLLEWLKQNRERCIENEWLNIQLNK